jgi:hypothetical protein
MGIMLKHLLMVPRILLPAAHSRQDSRSCWSASHDPGVTEHIMGSSNTVYTPRKPKVQGAFGLTSNSSWATMAGGRWLWGLP